jgi:DNA modification methylase
MIEIYNKNSLEIFYKIVNKYHDKKIIIVTDPPFNINYKYNTYNDNMDEDEYYEMLDFYFHDIPSVVIHYPENLYKLSFQIGKFPEKVISWVYNSNTGKQHRDIAFFDIKPDMSKVRQPYKNPNDKRIKERIARGCKGAKLYDWWNINQVKNVSKQKTKHPCQMPIEVMENIIGILPEDAIIIDPFMGSGTTGVAVNNMNKKQNTKRGFIGIEIDKEYYRIAKERIENK